MSLGENIYQYRCAKSWSQMDLASALDVSRQSVSKWENNMAIPDLDKLIKMRILFDVSLDDLVFGEPPAAPSKPDEQRSMPTAPLRIVIGLTLLVFGMIFFLLSIFWGDHLALGEVFGELLSSVIVLISVVLIAPYNLRAVAVASLIYLIYSIVCFGILNVTDVINYLFTSLASIIIFVWFITCGLHHSRTPATTR